MTQVLAAVVIGLGSQTLDDHIPAILRRNDIEVIGVCDPDLNARERFRHRFPALRTVQVATGLAELLVRTSPAVAFVAVPHHRYPDIVTTLCRLGIPFLKEKPLARNLAEAHSLLAIPGFREYGFIATQRRYSPLFQQARQAVRALTDAYLFHVVYTMNVDAPGGGWRGRLDFAGGGCLVDMGYHMVDQLVWWFGQPERVTAQISALAVPGGGYDAEDSATVSLRYPGGLHGVLVVSRAAGTKAETYEVYGSSGYIAGSRAGFTVHDRAGTLLDRIHQDRPQRMTDEQLTFFLSRVRAGNGFDDVQRSHLSTMELIDRCYHDARAVSSRPRREENSHAWT